MVGCLRRQASRRQLMSRLGGPHRWQASSHSDLCTPDLWELALPGIVIQTSADVLAVSASSRVKPAPTVELCTPDLWELDLPAIEREAVVNQTPPYVPPALASSRVKPAPTVELCPLDQWLPRQRPVARLSVAATPGSSQPGRPPSGQHH
ncbi:protein of unknown function [Pseudomonas sp. JV241A]|nr:protein of unknown function [Pseudomonas sp. JV241A]